MMPFASTEAWNSDPIAAAARLARCALLGLVAVVAVPTLSASADDEERRRIAEERSAIEARYAARERECRERFVVTSCVEDARRDRRRGLDALRTRQLQLDEARRRARTEERSAELADKAAEDARREQARAGRAASGPARSEPRVPSAAPARASSDAPASAGSATARPSRATKPAPHEKPKPAPRESAAERSEREARSRASFEARQRDAAEHRREVLEKAEERRKERPPAAPLPVPSGPAR